VSGSRLLPRSEATAAGSKVQISESSDIDQPKCNTFWPALGVFYNRVCPKNDPKHSSFKNLLFHGENDDNHPLGHGILHFKNPTYGYEPLSKQLTGT